jgi:hypothetical protein
MNNNVAYVSKRKPYPRVKTELSGSRRFRTNAASEWQAEETEVTKLKFERGLSTREAFSAVFTLIAVRIARLQKQPLFRDDACAQHEAENRDQLQVGLSIRLNWPTGVRLFRLKPLVHSTWLKCDNGLKADPQFS